MKRLKQTDILRLSLDYLEVLCTFKDYRNILRGLDGDNSNTRNFHGFTIAKETRIRNYQFKISFLLDNQLLFAWYKGGSNGGSEIISKDFFTAYGKAFHYFEYEEILEFIYQFFEIQEGNSSFTIRRFDIAIDFTQQVEKVVASFGKILQKGSMFFDASGKVETRYIGDKSYKNNKSHLIRIYNKIADIQAKGNQKIYPDFLKEEYVTRVELEVRSDRCKDLKLESLLSKEYLYGLLYLFLKKYTKIFNGLKVEGVVKLMRAKKGISLDDLDNEQILSEDYLLQFRGFAKKIYLCGGCPIDHLLRFHLVSDTTLREIATSSKGKDSLSLVTYNKHASRRNARTKNTNGGDGD